ncbi:MauE/DoxX family redox-associated membrane protein [Pedobacter sp.]|uniref:MauE/DoxX family redox-associated membrane protein n=1 Tax=Pedobacter sp. TaxID=1411316 RepID=UPI003BAB002D
MNHPSKKLRIYNTAVCMLLILLWIYAALQKLSDFEEFRRSMYNQVFPSWFVFALLFMLPASELVAAGLLFFERTRQSGILLSAGLLSAFTVYIALILLHYFPRVPCSCGGVLSILGWREHLAFNLAFLALSVSAMLIQFRFKIKKNIN